MLENFKKDYSDTHCLQTSPLIFKYCPGQKKKLFVSTANKTPVGKLMKISDVTGNQSLFVETSAQAGFVHKLKNTQI